MKKILFSFVASVLVFSQIFINTSYADTVSGSFSSLISSSSTGQLIQEFSNSSDTGYQWVYVGNDANGNPINPTTYQGYYPGKAPTVQNVYSSGAPTLIPQIDHYRYFTASFAKPGLYSLAITQRLGDPIGAIYVMKGSGRPYQGVGVSSTFYAFSDDSNGATGTAPWTIYYNQTDSTCTTVQFLIYEYAGSGNSLTGSYQVNGPGKIASSCASIVLVSDTQASLASTAGVLQSAIALQNATLINGFTYDCQVFDRHGICISAGGRSTQVSADSINNTAG